jgi:DNA-binding winged helix-turn-helix (wHTH) protein
MRLLLCLAERPGEVVSIDDLLDQVWSDVTVAPDSVYQAVTSLRRLLGDDPKRPTYIATAPRLGYRLVATVGPWAEQSKAQSNSHTDAQRRDARFPRCADKLQLQNGLPVGRCRVALPRARRHLFSARRVREQSSLSLGRRCFAAAEIHRCAAISRPD